MSDTASIQFMITNAMKATLVDELEFRPEEVDVMRPEIAKELIEKKMKRPFGSKPMPEAWKRDYDPNKGGGGDGGGGGGLFGFLGPVGDLLRSVVYMSMTAGVALGVACAANGTVRKGVKGVVKDIKRTLKGKKRKKKKNRVRSNRGRGPSEDV